MEITDGLLSQVSQVDIVVFRKKEKFKARNEIIYSSHAEQEIIYANIDNQQRTEKDGI